MNKKSLFVILIFIMAMSISSLGYASNIEYIDVSIGNYSLGKNIKLTSNSGFCIVDKDSKITRTDIDDNNIILRVNSSSNADIINSKGEFISGMSISSELIESKDGIISINGKRYRGYLSFLPNGKIINHVDLEEYLYGVLPREMSASFPDEALKAQAVASRSFAKTNLNKHKNEGYNLCNTTHCQVYGGVDGENPRINNMVDSTRGICVYYDGKVAETVFHSNNGGYIESSRGAWGGDLGHLQAKEDRFSLNSPNSSWKQEYSRSELSNRLNNAGVRIGNLTHIEILEISDGQRVKKLRIKGSNGEKIITGAKFRSILGNGNFKSTWFRLGEVDYASKPNDIYALDSSGNLSKVDSKDVHVVSNDNMTKKDINKMSARGKAKKNELNNIKEPSTGSNGGAVGENIIFNGRGFGHGVGMSQYGAKTMADEGYNYIDILKHYYKDVEIY